MIRLRTLVLLATLGIATACADPAEIAPPAPTATPATRVTTSLPSPTPTTPPAAPSPTPDPFARPTWLGTRVLEESPDGTIPAQPTPPELVDRRLRPPRWNPVVPATYPTTVADVPDNVLARSTWSEDCPVGRGELRYVTLPFRGFDGEAHAGELLVHADAADDVAAAFARLFDADFPIEEMRITSAEDLEAPPTGDGNTTSAFVCRPTRGTARWSQHAYGLALDINPFHNPYTKGDQVLPELASAYVDRSDLRPGMIVAGDVVTRAFADIGWTWGGAWSSPVDPMHVSRSGR